MFSDTTLVGHREMGGGHTSQASESCWSGWRQKNTNTKLPPTSLSAGWWFQPPSYEPRTVSFPIRLLLPHSSQRSLGWRTIRASGSPASLPVLQPFLLQSQWDLSKIRVVPLSCLKSSLILLKKKKKANSFLGELGPAKSRLTWRCQLPRSLGATLSLLPPLPPHPPPLVIWASAKCTPQEHLRTHTW